MKVVVEAEGASEVLASAASQFGPNLCNRLCFVPDLLPFHLLWRPIS